MDHPRATHGFTLLELMAAVTVLAVLLSIGVPSFAAIIRRNRVATQTNELVTALAIARSEAVKRGEPVAVCSTNAAQTACVDGWSGGWIVFTDAAEPGVVDDTDVVLQRWSPPSEDKIGVDEEAGVSFVRYRADGRAQSASFNVVPQSCHADEARIVEVSSGGRVTSRTGACP